MKVRSLRRNIEALLDQAPAVSDEDLLALKAFVASLKLNDSKNVEELCEVMGLDIASWFRRRQPAHATQPQRPPVADSNLEIRFREAFNSDQKFSALISTLRSDRKATKALLQQAYRGLFGERSISANRTKAQLLQDIADERLVRVRHEKAVRALAGTAAE